jgi:hypothetical protein
MLESGSCTACSQVEEKIAMCLLSQRMLAGVAMLCLCLPCAGIAAGQDANAAADRAFEESLRNASHYAIQFNDPASVQKGINLYAATVSAFPNHTRVYEAKLGIFDILRCDGSEQSLGQAAAVIKELVDQKDLQAEAHEDLVLRFASFHTEELQGMPRLRDLQKAESLMSGLTSEDPHSLLRLRVASRMARIRVIQQREVKGLQLSLDTLTQAVGWASSNFWSDLFKNDQATYEKYVAELDRISGAGAWAANRSKDPAVSRMLRARPILLMHFKNLREALKEFEERYVLGGPGEFEKLEAKLHASVAKIGDQLPLPPEPASAPESMPASAKSHNEAAPSRPVEQPPAQKGSGHSGRAVWVVFAMAAAAPVCCIGLWAFRRKRR